MPGITPVPTSYTTSGQYTSNWWSTTDIKMPDIAKEKVDKYGHAFGLFEIWNLIGKTYNMPNDTHSIYEQDSLERPITLADVGTGVGIATNSAGASITFKLASTDYDTRGNAYLRVSDVVLIPKQYLALGTLIDYGYLVTSTASSGINTIYTAIPLYADGTTFAQGRITTAIPTGTQLAVTYSAHGRGTHQPRGLTLNWFKKTYRTGIMKDTWELEGGNESQTWIEVTLSDTGQIVAKGTPGSRTGLMAVGQQLMEFMIDKKINHALLMSQPNENATYGVTTNDAGENTPYLTTTGLLPHCELLAQKMPYSGSFTVPHLDSIKPLMISQGLTGQDIMWLMGDLLFTDVENGAYNFIKEFGHDPVMTAMDSVGLNFRVIKKNGYNFIIRELNNFSNPNNYGLAAYNDYYRKLGLMIPMGDNPVKMGSEDSAVGTISNLTIGYKNYGGENRTRVMRAVNGMTGYTLLTVNDVDAVKGYVLTEPALIVTKINQFVKVYDKDA